MAVKIRYTADDEEPECGMCEHVSDDFDCVHLCGAEHGWHGYERIETAEESGNPNKHHY